MAYPMIYAALFLAVSMAFINDAEGRNNYPCNDAEIEICKNGTKPDECYISCHKGQPCNCQVTCNYKTSGGGRSASLNSPNGQECKMNNEKGICTDGACIN